MTMGWTQFFRSAPAMTLTIVAPSPVAESCDLESLTSIFAMGYKTCGLLRMVAPSLVMMTSLVVMATVLSMPVTPRTLSPY